MHRSRLAGFIIDCRNTQVSEAARFWGEALGMPQLPAEDNIYQELNASSRDLHIEVQSVSHESRIHLDIETDDLEAEVLRLEKLGARKIAFVKRWWVLEAPTGQRFCVVKAKKFLNGAGINEWENKVNE